MDNVQCTSKFASRECRMFTCAYFGWHISMMSDVVQSASTIGQLDMATSRCRVGIGPLWALEWEANSWLCTIAVLLSGTQYLYQAHNTCIRHVLVLFTITWIILGSLSDLPTVDHAEFLIGRENKWTQLENTSTHTEYWWLHSVMISYKFERKWSQVCKIWLDNL